jgi:predicted transcriptional regulator
MTVGELAGLLGFEVLTDDAGLDREITSGYVSDLLSDVIANAEENSVWITVQRHINILGVAKLKDISAIIIPRKLQLESDVLEKARDEEIAILRDHRNAFEIAGAVYTILKERQK